MSWEGVLTITHNIKRERERKKQQANHTTPNKWRSGENKLQ